MFKKYIYVEHCEFENVKIMTTQICFMSDVEGDIHYFEKFCENSKIIEQNPEKTEIKFRPGCENCHFVFGGDSQDQGIGDIRFVKMLLDFKEKNKEQVHLIAGNRDVNKMRLKAELYEVEKYFDPNSTSLLFEDNFPCWLEGDKDAFRKFVNEEEFSRIPTLIEMKKKYLDWAFTKTLGMHFSFKNRAQELLEFGQTVRQKENLKLVVNCIDIQKRIDDCSKAIEENQKVSNELIENSTEEMKSPLQEIQRQFDGTKLSHSIDEKN